MCSIDFGTFPCEGYPQSFPREAIARPSGAIGCPDVFCHRFVSVSVSILGGVFEHLALFEASSSEVFF